MKRIVMTGGGSAGHVTPNLALIPGLIGMGYEVHYLGTRDGMERKLVEGSGVHYHAISAGKLRRYFDWKNFSDPFKVLAGIGQAMAAIRKLQPDVVFAKGGFVSFPVVVSAKLNGIPVIIHESDLTPGLANRLSEPFATRICYTFPETGAYLPKGKGILTGIPVRDSLLRGDARKGLETLGFSGDKPVITVIGGSQGARAINEAVRRELPGLLVTYQICHICGKNACVEELAGTKGYRQFEYVDEQLPDIFACTSAFISRSGATTLYEMLALKKPNLLIPLSRKGSRGDQILNAQSFERQGLSRVLPEEDLTPESLANELRELLMHRARYIKAMDDCAQGDSKGMVLKLIGDMAKR